MSFYSPYQQHPAWGQGISDIANQLMQFMLMQKYGGGGQNTTQKMAQTQVPPQSGTARMGAGMMTPPAVGNMGQNGVDPQMLIKLAQALGIDLTQILGR